MKLKVREIAATIEAFAPKELKESWDNPGLQVGNPEQEVSSAMVCLDVTEEILQEAAERDCGLIIAHHPLLFSGLKSVTGSTPTERIVIEALKKGIAIYAAHTNLDSTFGGVSYEMARELEMKHLQVLESQDAEGRTGLGVIGEIDPLPSMEFLRRLKERFHVRNLRFSVETNKLVIRKVALCGGSGASLIKDALEKGADAYVTGDIKYHDFTTYGRDLLLADVGHYESELCTRKLFTRILKERHPDFEVVEPTTERNPIGSL